MIGAPEPLHAGHDRSAFDCGKPALDDWLESHALANQAKGFTRVVVVCEGDRAVAFYGLAPRAVPPPVLSRAPRTGLHPDPTPAIRPRRSCSGSLRWTRPTPVGASAALCCATP